MAIIQPLIKSTASLSAESSSSAAMSTGQSNASSPAVLGLRIDTRKANDMNEDDTPPQKTPTESLKESLRRFSIATKAAARFPID